MSDPGRQGPTADTAPKVRRRRFREHIARLLADMAGRRHNSYADLKQKLDIRTKELSEALDRETATSRVLGIISSTPSDLEPVFETILANATRLCEAIYGTLWLCEGDTIRAVALHGAVSAAFAAERRRGALRPSPGGPLARAARTRQTIHVTDLRAEQARRGAVQDFMHVRDGTMKAPAQIDAITDQPSVVDMFAISIDGWQPVRGRQHGNGPALAEKHRGLYSGDAGSRLRSFSASPVNARRRSAT